MAPPEVGQILAGKFRVEGILGKGGMGVVLQARHTLLNERVAIKILRHEGDEPPDDVQRERFLREGRASARLRGVHIARVMDVGILEDGSPYLVLENIAGQTLAQKLRAEGPLSVGEAVDLILQVCEGVAEAHAAGIIHRDLKLSNLMVTMALDGSALVKILDFGIAKAKEHDHHTLTESSSMLGSPAYMSPEQIHDPRWVDARSDIWSIGVCLYELLTDKFPFEAFTAVGLIARITNDTAIPIRQRDPNLPIGIEILLNKCLAKEVDDRYDDVCELARDLVEFSPTAGQGVVDRIARVMEHAPRVHKASGALSKKSPSTEVKAKTTEVATVRAGGNQAGAGQTTNANNMSGSTNREQQATVQTLSGEPLTISSDGRASSTVKKKYTNSSWLTRGVIGVCIVVVLALAAWGLGTRFGSNGNAATGQQVTTVASAASAAMMATTEPVNSAVAVTITSASAGQNQGMQNPPNAGATSESGRAPEVKKTESKGGSGSAPKNNTGKGGAATDFGDRK